jgi:hypothetical protein
MNWSLVMRRGCFKAWSALAITLALMGTPLHAQFVYVGDPQGQVWGFAINPATGALSSIAGSPFATGAGAGAVTVVVHPSGRFAYVASLTPNTITGYTINSATGALATIAGSPFATGNLRDKCRLEFGLSHRHQHQCG